jgi:hypothetical protein
MKAKEIILLIFIVTAGIFFYHAQTGKIWIDWEWDEGIYFGQEEYVYEETEEVTPPFPLNLHIINAHGHVEVEGADQDSISILFEKRIVRRKQTQADEVAEDLRMIVDKDGTSIRISTNREDFRKRQFRTNFKVVIPEQMAVNVKNSYGEVRVSHAGETEIRNPNGRVYAENIHGNLTVENSYKDVEVENIHADCRIESGNASVTAISVEGSAYIDHKYGKIHLENIGQSVTVDGSYTEVYGHNVTGLFDIQTSYKKVDLSDVGPVQIRASNCRIEIKGAKDYVDIDNKYGKVELFDIHGNLKIDGKNLEVYGHSIIGETIVISTSYRKVELTGFQGKTEITQSNGDVGLEPLPLTHPIEVKGRYTDIKFYWHSGWSYPIEARAKGGNVEWNVSVGLSQSFDEENGFKVIKAFVTEVDKPSILLNTTYGSIRIEEY